MGQLIDDILKLSQLSRTEMIIDRIDLSAMVREIAAELQDSEPGRRWSSPLRIIWQFPAASGCSTSLW